MGTIQGAMNTIIASGAAAAAAIGKSTKTEEPIEQPTETKPDKPKKKYTKPTLSKPSIGNEEAQKVIRNRYNQDKDFAARYDKVKAKISKDASEAKKNMQEEYEHKKFEKKKTEAINTLTELQEHLEGGKK